MRTRTCLITEGSSPRSLINLTAPLVRMLALLRSLSPVGLLSRVRVPSLVGLPSPIGLLTHVSLLPLVGLLPIAGLLSFLEPVWAEEPDLRYWRLEDIRAIFDIWEIAYPEIFYQSSLGPSGEGVTIPSARISDNAGRFEPEPRLVFHAAQHANECNGTGAILQAMDVLLAGYGVDPEITARVDGLEIYFIPVLNPDGHDYVFSGAPHWADWRKTLRDNNDNGAVDFPDDGVDLNRNWDWFWEDYTETDAASQKYKGPYPWSEPEIVALRNFVLDERPVLVVDYHSPVEIFWSNYIFWPWVSTHGWGESPDGPVAREIAQEWAASTLTVDGQQFHSIFAYDTLPKEQCWIYGNTGILTFVMEISNQCWWSGAAVDTIAARVARGSVYLLDRTLGGPGITGFVTDASTGAPLQAEVQLAQMHAPEVGPRLTEARFGQYHRLTRAGSYTVQVSCRGYISQTQGVTVGATGWISADFALVPEVTAVGGVDEGTASDRDTWLQTGNPCSGGRVVRLSLPAGVRPARVELFDLRGRRVATLGRDLAAAREHELRLPGHLPSGVYLLRARAGEGQQVERLVVLN